MSFYFAKIPNLPLKILHTNVPKVSLELSECVTSKTLIARNLGMSAWLKVNHYNNQEQMGDTKDQLIGKVEIIVYC